MRAEIRAGELLTEMAEKGERDSGRGNRNPTLKSQGATPKLSDIGVSKSQSSRWQQLAALPKEAMRIQSRAVRQCGVLLKQIDGVTSEPCESLSVDVESQHQGAVMEALGQRRGELVDMAADAQGRVRLAYRIPARGLIGFQGEFMNLTRGTGLMSHVFDGFAPVKGDVPERRNGVLVSQEHGDAVAYALWNLQERGRMFVSPGDKLYEGMVIGIHSRDNDLVVNPIKGKKLTNIRAAGKDDAILLTPPIALTLEYAVEFIADDELVEVTPKSIRIRKRHLKEHERKRASREAA